VAEKHHLHPGRMGSPHRLDVSYASGMIDMSLWGKWVTDADVTITGKMGGGVVHLPRRAILEGLKGGPISPPGGSEPDLPTLRFSVTTLLGVLEFAEPRRGNVMPVPAGDPV